MTLDIRKLRQEHAKATRSQLVCRECRTGLKCTIIFSFFLITSAFASCETWQKRDIEGRLISEMAGDCKKVQIKRDYAQEVYVIMYTGKVSRDGCPVALLQGWKGERLIKEKELEICGCKEAKGK